MKLRKIVPMALPLIVCMQTGIATPGERFQNAEFDSTWSSPDPDRMKSLVFEWICRNPGKGGFDVASHFGISGHQALEIVDELLAEGLLDFDD